MFNKRRDLEAMLSEAQTRARDARARGDYLLAEKQAALEDVARLEDQLYSSEKTVTALSRKVEELKYQIERYGKRADLAIKREKIHDFERRALQAEAELAAYKRVVGLGHVTRTGESTRPWPTPAHPPRSVWGYNRYEK